MRYFCVNIFIFPEKDSVYFYPCCYISISVTVRKESHISFYVSVWAVIRLESNILLGGFKVHVTYILNAITWEYLYWKILMLEILFTSHSFFSV